MTKRLDEPRPDSTSTSVAVHVAVGILLLFAVAVGSAAPAAPGSTHRPSPRQTALPGTDADRTLPSLVPYRTPAFSIYVPKGWEATVSGVCSTLSLVARDPRRPVRQLFFVASLGPVYLREAQKRIDARHLSSGGEAIPWFEMPVVEPLEPEGFLRRLPVLVSTGLIRRSRRGLPALEDLYPVASTPRASRLESGDGEAILSRVLFVRGDTVGQGQIAATVVPVLPFTGEPGEGVGYGVRLAGITAAEADFPSLQGDLVRALDSLRIREEYAARCRALRHQTFDPNVLEPGRLLRPLALDMVDAWKGRSAEEDRRVRELIAAYREGRSP